MHIDKNTSSFSIFISRWQLFFDLFWDIRFADLIDRFIAEYKSDLE